jgi:hypothetical protein
MLVLLEQSEQNKVVLYVLLLYKGSVAGVDGTGRPSSPHTVCAPR